MSVENVLGGRALCLRFGIGAMAMAVALLSSSPLHAQESSLAGASWLAGCWQLTAQGRQVDEQWMSAAGGVMLGMSRTVRDGRMRGFELVRIEERQGTLVYVAEPSGQARTEFTASKVAADTLVFENPEHDFPKKIEYLPHGADSLIANVSADGNGFQLRMGRITCPG